MDCKITSTKRCAGVTLTELLISVGLAGLVMMAIASLTFFSGRSFAALSNYVDLDSYSRKALDSMSQEIRQVNSLSSFTTNKLVFVDYDGQPLTYQYFPALRELRRIKGVSTRVLLPECDFLQFMVFQRNPVGGGYDIYPTATADTAKLVQLQWVCSRKIFGAKANTESVQSAKIVIRKQ